MKSISVSRNVLFGFLSWFLPLGFTFAFTPLIVRGLGAEGYGLYALVMGFISYSFSFSIGRAITRYVSAYHASRQTERIGEVLSSTLILNLCVSFLSAGALALLTGWLVTRVLNIPLGLQPQARLAFYLASVGLIFTMLSQVLNAVPQAVQRFDVYSLIATSAGITTIAGNALLVWMDFGATALIAWNVAATALSCVAYLVASRRLLPEARLTLQIKRDVLVGIIKFSSAVTAYQVMANLLLLFERSWLTRSLGTASVTYYVVPITIAVYIHAFISSLTLMIFPMVSEAGARQDSARLQAIYTRAFKYISMMVVFLSLTLAVGSRQILSNWLGADFAQNSSGVLAIQAAVFGLMAMLIVPWQIADGLGFPGSNALLGLWWLVATVLLALFFTPRLGLMGMAYSRLIPMLITPVYILYVERRVFGRNLWQFWRRVCLSLFVSGGLTAVIEVLLFRHLPEGWLWLVINTGVGALLFWSLLLITRFMDTDEQQWLRRFFSRAVAITHG
jgi:O-antigen/teichoic acid export membrane protein